MAHGVFRSMRGATDKQIAQEIANTRAGVINFADTVMGRIVELNGYVETQGKQIQVLGYTCGVLGLGARHRGRMTRPQCECRLQSEWNRQPFVQE